MLYLSGRLMLLTSIASFPNVRVDGLLQGYLAFIDADRVEEVTVIFSVPVVMVCERNAALEAGKKRSGAIFFFKCVLQPK